MTKRDDRAEPDDDGSAGRVERVDVVGGAAASSRDSTANAVVSLRRELARLAQQATAVERSLEDQRRDRSDAMDRLEKATERVLSLEARITTAEADAASLRRMNETARDDLRRVCEERDDLARAVEAAKSQSAELSKIRDEVDAAKRDVARLESELVEAKKAHAADASRAGAKTAEVADLEAKVAKLGTELEDAKREIERRDAAVTGLKNEVVEAREAAATVRDEADRERIGSREQVERLERLLAEAALDKEARVETDRLRAELEKAQATIEDAEKRAGEADARAKVEAEKASAADERAKAADARADAAIKEADARAAAAEERAKAADARANEADVHVRQAEVVAASAEDRARQAEARAESADARASAADERAREADARTAAAESRESTAVSRATVMDVRAQAAEGDAAAAEERTKDAVAAYNSLEKALHRLRDEIAFAFERAGVSAPAGSRPPPPVTLDPSMPPERPRTRPPPIPEASLAPASPASPPALVLETLDDAWSVPPGEGDGAPAVPPDAPSSPASKSVPPPLSQVSETNGASEPKREPPRPSPPRPSQAPRGILGFGVPLPAGASVRPSVPEMPATDGETPSAPNVATSPPAALGTAPPPTRRANASEAPGDQAKRDLLVSKLGDPDAAHDAAELLREHPEWMRSLPPPELVTTLSSVDYDVELPVFDVARSWERDPLCHALVTQLKSEKEPRLREHGAWLLKHLAAASSWKPIADLARSDDESGQTRRWLIEALERLAASRAIGWRELGELVGSLYLHPDATIRDGIVGILGALERSDEKRRLLLEILHKDDDESVLASAVQALASVLPVDLDPVVVERLLSHPSTRVQRSVRDLVERAKKEARS
ncbi:MAG TPA: hypothetical protein VIF62_37190 [Labilithrix sp.]